MTFDESKEPLLIENKYRHTLFPVRYHDIWDLYKKSLASFWVVEEIDFSKDITDWKVKLNDNERSFIKNILAFFACGDGIVNENIILNFYSQIQVPEVRSLYSVQILIESIHSEAYSLMIDTYITDHEEKSLMFKSITENSAVKLKADWALKWIEKGSFAERLVAFAAVEGVFFSGSFCAIFWLRSRGYMFALAEANTFISRDENLHCETAVMLYSKLIQKLDTETIHKIFKEAYEIEENFINEVLDVSLIGMNKGMMKQYIKFVVDFWLAKLGYPKIYNETNPFDFMNFISLETKVNFFERTVSEYNNGSIISALHGRDTTITESGLAIDDTF